MAPRKNMPMTIFSWNGATNDILGLNMYTMPRQRKNRQPVDTSTTLVTLVCIRLNNVIYVAVSFKGRVTNRQLPFSFCTLN